MGEYVNDDSAKRIADLIKFWHNQGDMAALVAMQKISQRLYEMSERGTEYASFAGVDLCEVIDSAYSYALALAGLPEHARLPV